MDNPNWLYQRISSAAEQVRDWEDWKATSYRNSVETPSYQATYQGSSTTKTAATSDER
ncbi:hypothetical protein GCM10009100_00270 [Thalassospira tepidiphila]